MRIKHTVLELIEKSSFVRCAAPVIVPFLVCLFVYLPSEWLRPGQTQREYCLFGQEPRAGRASNRVGCCSALVWPGFQLCTFFFSSAVTCGSLLPFSASSPLLLFLFIFSIMSCLWLLRSYSPICSSLLLLSLFFPYQ